jgi:uncharacterized repeat protein (TIGR03803 family)
MSRGTTFTTHISRFAVLALAVGAAAWAQTFSVLNSNLGSFPRPLIQGTDGNFYGGASNEGYAIVRITPAGVSTTLATGVATVAPLVQATDGNFYGTSNVSAYGTIFRMTPEGALTTIHTFDTNDGADPRTALIQASDGNLYGIANAGGSNSLCGTFFRISLSGTFKLLFNFGGPSAGCAPTSILQGIDGNFYGSTGKGIETSGGGTFFKITREGEYTTLNDSVYTIGNVVQATNGSFYGVSAGGANNYGFVFELTTTGTLTDLFDFTVATGYDQFTPQFIQATDGNFYGTATSGANLTCVLAYGDGCGTIFRVSTGGAFSIVHVFDTPDGATPSGIFEDTDGNLYGTTFQGDAQDNGILFSLSLGLAPFVETIPTTASIGTAVTIYGNNLTGATSVSFNGTPASFTVLSETEISATVPTGATTGRIEVVTPSATLYSNLKLKVI